MIQNVPSLDQLVHELSKLPGIGPKSAQRIAYNILKKPHHYHKALLAALDRMSSQVRECSLCFTYTEEIDLCRLCQDSSRRKDLLCVVEDPADILRLESSGAFQGQYHVLHGALSPLDGISTEDIRLDGFFKRIQSGEIKEIILALDTDLEGDTTVLYIVKELKNKKIENVEPAQDIKITRLAHGIPIGSDIDFVDHRTLGRALQNRIQL